MGSNTYSDETDSYWHRRVYVLIALLVTVGLVAWACSGSDGKKSTAQIRNAGMASPNGSPGAKLPAGVPTVTVTVTATPSGAPGKANGNGDACEEKDVVLNVTPGKESFKGKEPARLTTSVVNTGPHACTLDVSPKNLEIRVTSGSDRVWSSAKCLRGAKTNIQPLKRGVPYLVRTDWDRKRSPGGCAGSRLRAHPGTYAAIARTGNVRTKRATFRLK